MAKKVINPTPLLRVGRLVWEAATLIDALDKCATRQQVDSAHERWLAWAERVSAKYQDVAECIGVFLTDTVDPALAVLIASGAKGPLFREVIEETRKFLLGAIFFGHRACTHR